MRRYHSLYFSLRLVKNSTTVEVLPKHTCTVAQLLWGGASASLAAFPNLVTPCNIEISSAVILVQNRCCCAIKGSPLQYHGKYNKASSHVKKNIYDQNQMPKTTASWFIQPFSGPISISYPLAVPATRETRQG